MAKRGSRGADKAGEGEVNKSQTIRDYVTANPETGPTAVAAALNAEHGWEITPAYVSTIKNKMKEVSGGGFSRGPRSKGDGGLSEQSLIQAKELARQAGGINQAKAALDLLDRLTK